MSLLNTVGSSTYQVKNLALWTQLVEKLFALRQVQENLNFCICFPDDLCYRGFIPVVRAADLAASPDGSSLRHWPPGTNSLTVRAVFFAPKSLGSD
jgi:hypothetical protein